MGICARHYSCIYDAYLTKAPVFKVESDVNDGWISHLVCNIRLGNKKGAGLLFFASWLAVVRP